MWARQPFGATILSDMARRVGKRAMLAHGRLVVDFLSGANGRRASRK